MNRLRIKFCGITNPEDAVFAAHLGVDAIGVICSPSAKKYVEISTVAAIVRALPPFVDVVALFVNPSADEVRTVVNKAGVHLLQFHGDENAAFCESFACPYLKACYVRDSQSVLAMQNAHPQAAGIIADSEIGGSGKVFDWDLLPPSDSRPNLIVAGGLNPDNVASAVAHTRPWGVDVSSGISTDTDKRQKCQQKMRDFYHAAMGCAEAKSESA